MKVSKAAKIWIDYLRTHSKKTLSGLIDRSYQNSVMIIPQSLRVSTLGVYVGVILVNVAPTCR